MEVFSLITGILYLLLEIRQKNAMWIVGILTSGAAVVVFANEHLYASMCLNIYYVIISFWGLYTWKRDARKVASEEIHLEKLTLRTGLLSILLLTGGTAGFLWLLRTLGDPMSGLDAFVTILSAIATWWLTAHPVHPPAVDPVDHCRCPEFLAVLAHGYSLDGTPVHCLLPGRRLWFLPLA